MADDSNLMTISEEGCLRWRSSIRNVVYHKSLNVLLGLCHDANHEAQIVVIDVASGTILHNICLGSSSDVVSDVANENTSPIRGHFRWLSIPEHGTLIITMNSLLGVRKDIGRAVLLESMLQDPIANEEDIVCMELPYNEAMLLRECLQTIDLSQTDPELGNQQAQVITLLSKHIKQYLFSAAKGSRMSSNWSIVTLELPLKTLKAVCTHAVLELKKNNRSIPALPIAASIVVRLSAMQRQSTNNDDTSPFVQSTSLGTNNNTLNSTWESSLCPNLHPMMSEAARRETFASWPHMNYKWALPAQMAEAGFYHQPNTPESDRAVCFLCNVCLICWEPSDEPWSEHERHAPSCPLVKGDYTCNVPVSAVMATQPAVKLEGQDFVCLSATTCPDLFATCTSAGNICLWNVSGPLKKEASFDAPQLAALPTSSQVTSLFVSGSSGQPLSRCSIAVGLKPEGQAPCLTMYDVMWRHPLPEGPSPINGQPTMKKGGTTKKILPAVLTQNHAGSTGTSSESGPNQGLFFSFGDDPLEEDMYLSSSLDAGDKLGKTSGFLDKLMLNMGSPFTNAGVPHVPQSQMLLANKPSTSATSLALTSGSASKTSELPEVHCVATLSLKEFGAIEGDIIHSLTPTWDANYLVTVLSTPSAESIVLVFKHQPDSVGLIGKPVCWTKLSVTPKVLIAIPSGDRIEDHDWTGEERPNGPMRMAVVTSDGQLRLLLIDIEECCLSLTNPEVSAHRFVDVTFCSSVERICACTDKGELVFLKISSYSSWKTAPKGKDVPAKLLVNQNVTPETLKSVYQLTQAEALPGYCQLSVTAAPCWIEMAVTQRHRRQPHPWVTVKPGGGTGSGEEGVQMARMFRLQKDKFSWDEHFFEITLPVGVSLAHIHLRFILLQSCPALPEIQVSLLEKRSRGLHWGRSKVNEEVDNHINFNVLQTPGSRYINSSSEINPITTPEYLDAHDAVLLCGPLKLNQFVDASGQMAVLTLSSHQLIQSKANNLLIHLKYIPSAGQANSVSLLSIPKPMTNPCGRRSIQTKGCDWIQEMAISVQRFKPSFVPQERCAILAATGLTDRLLAYGLKSRSKREHIIVLSVLNWITAVHVGAPPVSISPTSYDVALHVVEIFNHLKAILELFVVRGNRTTAQQAVQLLISTHELGIQCLTEDEVAVLTKQLMHCLLQQLNYLHECSSPSAVHWFSVLLARVYLRSDTEVAGPCWAVLTQIIAELHRRREPLQQLLQCRYGFYGHPFNTEPMFCLTEQLQSPGTKPVRSNIAASFAALNQLVNPAGPGDKDRSYNQLELLSLKRSCDLLDTEPLPLALISSSDGVRLERTDGGNSHFTAAALSGLVEAAKFANNQQAATHRWQHLLNCNTPLLVMERLHSGGRKFVTFDLGSPVLLTDIFIPVCVDWTSATIDVWNGNEKTKAEDNFVRLTSSSEINKRPLVLHDIQPPLVCRFVRLTVTGRHGLNAASCKVPATFFYGHSHILPTDLLPAQLPDSVVVLSRNDIEKNIATLEVLVDHTQCHYSMAGDRLQGLLQPMLSQWHKDSSVQAFQHVDHYLQSLADPGQFMASVSDEDSKIIDSYDECLKLQRQYNLLYGVLKRLQNCIYELDGTGNENCLDPIFQASTHKLHFIAHSLINVLLSATAKKQIRIERKTAEQLFQHLYVSCCLASQLSTAALLSQADDTYRWMPTFLADMLRRTLSSDASTILIPKDRVFVTLLFMGFKAIQLSAGIHLLDPILSVLSEQLAALKESGPMTQIDVPFLNWLLLFCCCCLDRTSSSSKETTKTDDRRWDFMQGDLILNRDGSCGAEPKSGSGSAAASRIYRRKLQKKLMQQPHYGVSWPSGGVLSGSNKAKFIFAHSKPKGSFSEKPRRPVAADDESEVCDEKDPPLRNASCQPVCSSNAAAKAARSLISLLLVLGASGSQQETFLLSCKVLSRLVGASQSGLRLGHIADEKQLTILLRLAASAARRPGQLWLNHAVYCLVSDYLRIGHKPGEACNGVVVQRESSSYDDILRAVVSEPEPGTSAAAGPSIDTKTSPSLLSLKPGSSSKSTVSSKKQTVVPHELLAYEQATLAAESLKVDHHMEDLMELFENPNSDSVPPVLKKAWPSISSVMKNLAECKSNAATTNYGFANGILSQEDSAISGVWDLRDESRVDGPWKQKSDTLGDAFFETVLQGLTSSFHDTKRRPLPEEVPGDLIASPLKTDRQLVSGAFNAIFTSTKSSRSRGDVLGSLKLWVMLNGMHLTSGLPDPDNTESGPVPLSSEAIRSLLESLAMIPVMDVGDWAAVLKGLAWLSSPRWLNNEPDITSLDCDAPQEPIGEELADQMCAGTLIRSPYLAKILYNFIGGQGLAPFSIGEKQLVGPSVVNALSDVLSALKVWCNTALVGSVLGNRLRRSLLELFLELSASPHGPMARNVGPFDAQICFVEMLLKLGIQGLETDLSIAAIRSVVTLTRVFLSRDGGLTCVDSRVQLFEDERICFHGLQTSAALSGLGVGGTSGKASLATPSVLLSLSLQVVTRLVLIDEGNGLPDRLLSSQSLMDDLFEAADSCAVSTIASGLGATALADADFASSQSHTVADNALQLLHRIAVCVSNVELLITRLTEYVTKVTTTASSSAGARFDISEPLLIFFLCVLRSTENVNVFHRIGGFKEVCLALGRSPAHLFDSHSRLVSNVLSYVSQTTAPNLPGNRSKPGSRSLRTGSTIHAGAVNPTTPTVSSAPSHYLDATPLVPLGAFRRGPSRADDDDDSGLLNLAPLSTISCGHPSAQPADILLQPNPPHRRARSPSWSHHFYPAEQFIELTVTLPCPVLVKEIQLHPHLTSLATCPSAVGVEMSTEEASQLRPVGPVQSATGLTTIAFKLEPAQVAGIVLLRLYKPRDSSNIGLAQIRILGSLALPASIEVNNPPGLTWLCILHHCLSIAEKESPSLMNSLLDTVSGLNERPGVLEQCSNLLSTEYTWKRTVMNTDVVQMASYILLQLGRHSSELSARFVKLQLHESPRHLVASTSETASIVYELCRMESVSERKMLFEWLHRMADQSSGSFTYQVSASMVHCAATLLWQTDKTFDDVITLEFARSLFEWAKIIANQELKAAVDYAICSICSHRPDYFDVLLESAVNPNSANSILDQRSLLETLARVAQSGAVLDRLAPTGLLNLVSQAISEFCLLVLNDEQGVANQEVTERAAFGLEFLAILCDNWGCGPSRDFLANYLSAEPLLGLLLKALCTKPGKGSRKVEDAAVSFFRKFCWAHQWNSVCFAEILLGILRPPGTAPKLLTGFTRRILLQLLLEPEKVYVHVQSFPSSAKLPTCASYLSSSVVVEPRHPQYGHGGKHRLLYLRSDMTLEELLRLLSDHPTATSPKLTATDPKHGNKRSAADCIPEGARPETEKKPQVLTSMQAMLDAHRRLFLEQFLKTHYYLTGPLLDVPLPLNWTLSQTLCHHRQSMGMTGPLELVLVYDQGASNISPSTLNDESTSTLTSVLDEFASLGGLSVLSNTLPMLFCAATSSTSASGLSVPMKIGTSGSTHPIPATSNLNGIVADTIDSWVKLDPGSDDMDEEMDDILMPSGYFPPPTPQYVHSKRAKGPGQTTPTLHNLPMHSLAAFSLFLNMPLYTEAVLQDKQKARMLLRLALGVSNDAHGDDILSSTDAATFPILPFVLLQQVLNSHPLDSTKGALLRQQAVDLGILQLLLACLAVFTQQLNSATVAISSLNVQFVVGSNGSGETSHKPGSSSECNTGPGNSIFGLLGAQPQFAQAQQLQAPQQQQYWAKGTGFGTGSTAQTWDLDSALVRQRQQEEQATCLFQTLAAYIHSTCPPVALTEPETCVLPTLPNECLDIIKSSYLVAAICSYLRNDSVMDMARHVPLYKSVLLILRSIAACPMLHSILLGSESTMESVFLGDNQSIHSLLRTLKNYVSGYIERLASVQTRTSSSAHEDSDSEEGIADLAKDIRNTWVIVKTVVEQQTGTDVMDGPEGRLVDLDATGGSRSSTKLEEEHSPERLYCEVMQPLQFDSYEFIVESPDTPSGNRFTVSYHFENAVKQAGERSHPNRMKRLAQETATLTTSLPLSLSSSVFVRCDTDRLDIMKVLITGPSDTPYANGCFEFDVYFPPDYPQSPMQVYLVTTGRHTVRFNPNLYNDGKVCLSVLNTWHGRPEEKWNPHTSSLLQVLVSIQSLILVSEPYFNEPGYERSRGTPSGNQNSRDYDVNIRQATVKWAMLEQIRNPSACFKQVTHAHFYLKKKEIEQQCDDWIAEMEKHIDKDPSGTRAVSVGLAALKRHYVQLKEELAKLSPPSCIMHSSGHICAEDGEPKEKGEKNDEDAARISPPLTNDRCQMMVYEEDEDDDEVDAPSQLLTKHSLSEGNNLKEVMFNANTDMQNSWKEDCDESEAETNNSVSQLTT